MIDADELEERLDKEEIINQLKQNNIKEEELENYYENSQRFRISSTSIQYSFGDKVIHDLEEGIELYVKQREEIIKSPSPLLRPIKPKD